MPSLYRVTFELLLYGLLVLCARHALLSGGLHTVWRLIAGVLFGVLLEVATIQQLYAYEYGQFLVMLGDVPLAIGVGWGVIIYTAQLVSEVTSLPVWLRPALDGLLALNIDLAMDALAIRLGMWQWGIPIDAQYFGVPYANFWAWFWVVFSFSLGVRLFVYRDDWIGRWLAPVGGIVLGVVIGLSTNFLIVSVISAELYLSAIGAVIGSALVVVLLARPQLEASAVPAVAGWVPLAFHGYFLVAGIVSGIFVRIPFLLLVSVVMTAVAVYLHRGSIVKWMPADSAAPL